MGGHARGNAPFVLGWLDQNLTSYFGRPKSGHAVCELVRIMPHAASAMRPVSTSDQAGLTWCNIGLIVAAVLIGCWYLVTPDRIPVGDGMGWDGVIYGSFAKDFPGQYHAGVTYYYLGRLLPSLLLHYALRAMGVARSSGSVIMAFRVLNAVLVIASALLWLRIARSMVLGISGRILGFAGLFLNFSALKMASYYPVLTDVPAFFLGLAMLCAYIENRFWILLVLTALGRFVWPTAIFIGAFMLIAPSRPPMEMRKELRWGGRVLAAGATLAYVFFTANLVIPNQRIWAAIADLVRPVWPLSLALAALYLLGALWVLVPLCLSRVFSVRWRDVLGWRMGIAALVLVGLFAASPRLATRLGTEMPSEMVLKLTAWTSVVMPLEFLLAHIVYFGPVLVLLLVSWRSVAAMMARVGTGLLLGLSLTAVLSLHSESRYLSNLWPMIVPFVAKHFDGRLSRRQLMVLLATGLLFSKVWLLIGSPASAILDFPAQLYFMNQGPWMSSLSYVIQAAAVLLLVFVLWMMGLLSERPALAATVPSLPSPPPLCHP
jgi:hypothetical protein